ncbi:MAG: peptide chain release factor 1 [Candidatus Delongbacteria bacterium]|nr:peptide chain release factor 1 [Candidatus Delongbacteria bacterium]MDD4205392.1 peptide chain release factor 1 [Candidatus Delongbacteria bacterium]
MKEKLKSIKNKYDSLTEQLSDPDIHKDLQKMKELGKERAKLEPIVTKYIELLKIDDNIAQAEEMLGSGDLEMKEMAEAELEEMTPISEKLTDEIKLLIVPKDPYDTKDIYLEIRAGTGGDEAGLFANDLYRMYQKYSERMGWSFITVDYNETNPGVLKEAIIEVSGDEVYGKMKFESGVHRVQRVPATETQGRVHTSAASVAVLPQTEVGDVEINEKDLKIDTYRSQGAGGQHVNTSDSAVRITHLPTGTVVTCQNERSQLKNRHSAMKILASRLEELEHRKAAELESATRKLQVGSGDRSAKIRTYNFPQGRITDHRIGLTLYKLDFIMDGNLNELIDALILEDKAEKLKNGDL